MIRSFVLAIVTVIAVAGAGSVSRLAAQIPHTLIKEFKVETQGGSQDDFVELYLKEGKVADVKIGDAWMLDLGSMGKSKVQIYVDVCEAGKVEKVLFTDGGMPPKDEDCDRKPLGAAFWSDCGVTKITLDFTRFGADVEGCGNFFRSPTGIATTLGTIALGGLVVVAGGGGDTTSSSSTSTSQPVTTNTPVNNNPGTTNPPTNPPGTTNPPNFTGALMMSHQHEGNTSRLCALITTDPPQQGTYSGTFSGPGVLSGGIFSGSLNPAGWAGVEARINVIGTYGVTGSVVAQGVTRTFSGSYNVTSGPGTCVLSK